MIGCSLYSQLQKFVDQISLIIYEKCSANFYFRLCIGNRIISAPYSRIMALFLMFHERLLPAMIVLVSSVC